MIFQSQWRSQTELMEWRQQVAVVGVMNLRNASDVQSFAYQTSFHATLSVNQNIDEALR